jgi:hypothetical protein
MRGAVPPSVLCGLIAGTARTPGWSATGVRAADSADVTATNPTPASFTHIGSACSTG